MALPSADRPGLVPEKPAQRRDTGRDLWKQAALFRQVAEQLRDVFYLLDADDQVVYVNPAYERIWGRTRESLYLEPQSWMEAIHGDDRERVRAALSATADAADHFDECYRIVRPDGSVRWIRDRTFPILGEVRRVGGFAEDVTDRRMAEEALRASERQNRAILDAALDAVIGMNAAGLVTYWNPRAEAIFGWPREEALGRPLAELIIPPGERARHARGVAEFLATGAGPVLGRRVEMNALRRDGSEFPVELSVTALQQDASFVFSAFVEDITDRRRAEAARQATERALRLLSGRLLRLQDEERRRIARELHDSLAQILAALSMNLQLAGRAAGLLPEAARQALADSQSLADQCALEIRTMSYLLHPPLLDEAGLASALSWYCEGLSARSGLRIRLDVKQPIGRLHSDIETAVFRVAQESLTNIHRHSGSEEAAIRLAQDDGYLDLEVSDRGWGIPKDVLHKIASEPAGLGVGIAGMRERVRQLGGRLEIVSGASGTSVRARIPIAARTDA
jgi:PAS domain S-box-containing protein